MLKLFVNRLVSSTDDKFILYFYFKRAETLERERLFSCYCSERVTLVTLLHLQSVDEMNSIISLQFFILSLYYLVSISVKI